MNASLLQDDRYFSAPLRAAATLLADLREQIHIAFVLRHILGDWQIPSDCWHSQPPPKVACVKADRDSELDCSVIQDVCHNDENAAARDEALLSEQASHTWADQVQELIRWPANIEKIDMMPPDEDNIFVHPYMRTPKEFMSTLLHGPALQHIRHKMETNNCPYVLEGSGAKIFVWPEQYSMVLETLDDAGMRLQASHIVIAESLLPELEASIARLPCKKNVRVKKDGIFSFPCGTKSQGCTSQHYAQDEGTSSNEIAEGNTTTQSSSAFVADLGDLLTVERTFLCVARPLRNANSVNQSTTEVHGSLNPRR